MITTTSRHPLGPPLAPWVVLQPAVHELGGALGEVGLLDQAVGRLSADIDQRLIEGMIGPMRMTPNLLDEFVLDTGWHSALSESMINHRLMMIGAALAVWNLAGCADRNEQMARDWQEHDAECRKFGAEPGMPAYGDCRAALRAIEGMELAALSPPTPMWWHEARAPKPGPHGDKRQHIERRDGSPGESGCSRIVAAQSVVLKCGPYPPITDLLAGLDQ